MRTAVVIPNHVPHLDFLGEWTDELAGAHIIIVQDGDEWPQLPDLVDGSRFPAGLTIYTWADIERDLGENAWIIPRRTSAVRSYGIWKAWQSGAEVIATLDNDCYPGSRPGWLPGHVENLSGPRTLDWWPSVQRNEEGKFAATRGFPYGVRDTAETWLSHGLWTNVPDLDAATTLVFPGVPVNVMGNAVTIPRWSFFPMCGMNLAWRRELTPAMWFGLFGPDYGFDQYDDIWCGVLAKKVLDVLGKAAVSGAPLVEHRRQSSPFVNLRKQAPGLEANEHFWQAVASIGFAQNHPDVEACDAASLYRRLVAALPDRIQGDEALPDGYFKRFKEGAALWAGLFA